MTMTMSMEDVAAPSRDWANRDLLSHSVQFYADDAFLLDGLSRYVGGALGSGDAAVVIATRPHRDGLAELLASRGLDLALAAAQGRYVALDAAETLARFMRDGQPDPARFFRTVGTVLECATAAARGERPRVAAYGEMVALLCAEGTAEAAIRLEQLWNELAGTHQFRTRARITLSLPGGSHDEKG